MGSKNGFGLCAFVNVLGMLATGTLNTLCTKIQFTLYSVGKDGNTELFTKAWFATSNMMFAMLVVGICDYAFRNFCGSRKGRRVMASPLLIDEVGDSPKGRSYWSKASLISIPAAFDILATGLCAIGMLYISASVWQMLRGSAVIFSAILSVMFLKRKLYAFNWLGLFFCCVGVGVVGVANVWSQEVEQSHSADTGRDPWLSVLGMCLVLSGQVVQAAQVIAEEYFMKEVDMPPFEIVGFEGLWGTLMMIFMVFPIVMILPGSDHGHVEDESDTLALLSNNPTLLAVVLTFTFSCATFNATGILVTSDLSGIHRMMLDLSRTILIWGFGLFVHYCVDASSAFGESWTQYSYMQLGGFCVLAFGQSVYGEVVKIPGLKYPELPPPMPSPNTALRTMSPLPREK